MNDVWCQVLAPPNYSNWWSVVKGGWQAWIHALAYVDTAADRMCNGVSWCNGVGTGARAVGGGGRSTSLFSGLLLLVACCVLDG